MRKGNERKRAFSAQRLGRSLPPHYEMPSGYWALLDELYRSDLMGTIVRAGRLFGIRIARDGWWYAHSVVGFSCIGAETYPELVAWMDAAEEFTGFHDVNTIEVEEVWHG